MKNKITGLHHVTATSDNPQENVDFYAGILGLRMVKKTVNFDAPNVYHLYYGNELGQPGTIMTFFPYEGLRRGRKGNGQLTVTSFSIPNNALEYWMKRLDKFNIKYTKPMQRFADEQFIYFEDLDGLGIELVANSNDTRQGFSYGQIPIEYAVKGFYGVTISQYNPEVTARLLTDDMEHKLVKSLGNLLRYSVSGLPGDFVDIVQNPTDPKGLNGAGTVHHLAFATPDDASQLDFREKIMSRGIIQPTPVMDRQYFHSIYFREPGGVLFEVATSDIGFTFDESKDTLGHGLKLAPWQEPNRSSIEAGLSQIELNPLKYMD